MVNNSYLMLMFVINGVSIVSYCEHKMTESLVKTTFKPIFWTLFQLNDYIYPIVWSKAFSRLHYH